jgi:hypothetical protein
VTMTAAALLGHLFAILRGLGAGLAMAALFFVVGAALIPVSWRRDSDRFGFPVAGGAALYVLVCWYGIGFGVPLSQLIPGFAAFALSMAGLRFRRVASALKGLFAVGGTPLRWIAVFAGLYVLAYGFFTPPVSSKYLPLAWYGNVDIFQYLGFTAYLQRLGPSNIPGYPYLDYIYFQTPAVFYILGLLSTGFGQEPIGAAMPALFTFIALSGVLAARYSRGAFAASWPAAVCIAGIVVSGPFFRYLAGKYFLSTMMSAPVLLHLLWTTVAERGPGRFPDSRLIGRSAVHYVLLLYLYPVFFFIGVAAQCALIGFTEFTVPGASPETAPPSGSGWRNAARWLATLLSAAGIAVLCDPRHVVWTIGMLFSLSQAGSVGWPMDFISPLAMLGLPGLPDRIAVSGGFSRIAATTGLCAMALVTMWFFWHAREKTTPVERAFVGLWAVMMIAYCLFFMVKGPSYQQWKFGSYCWMPLAFVPIAAGLRAWQNSRWRDALRRDGPFPTSTRAAGDRRAVPGARASR